MSDVGNHRSDTAAGRVLGRDRGFGVSKQAEWALYNEDVREMLGGVPQRSGLTGQQSERLTDE